MSETLTKYGILVDIDGSSESSAAVFWAAREASLRHEHVTLMHVVQPVAVSWPVSAGQATVAEWHEDNAQHVIDQAREVFGLARITLGRRTLGQRCCIRIPWMRL
jgi:nucleotide-binding universal stress UspA family protein